MQKKNQSSLFDVTIEDIDLQRMLEDEVKLRAVAQEYRKARKGIRARLLEKYPHAIQRRGRERRLGALRAVPVPSAGDGAQGGRRAHRRRDELGPRGGGDLICQNPEHYPQLDLPAEYDARLHNYDTGTPCEYAPKKYRTIVVDPPWSYRQTLSGALQVPDDKRGGKQIRGAAHHYDVMDICQIEAVPVGTWADDTAHMYIWVTNSFVEEGFRLMRTWGFEYKTMLTWIKTGTLGMGFYYRNMTEHVLFGVRGVCKSLRKDTRNHFTAPKTGHSEKPAAFYDMVESMSPGPYLDVFARRHRFSWDVYGNEVYSDIPLVVNE